MTLAAGHFIADTAAQRGGIFFRFLFLICFLFFLAVLYFARHPLLRLAGGFWVAGESPQASDAIVILSDDDFSADRASRAAQLFKEGFAPRIVASGRYLRPYASIADLMHHDLTDRGIPDSAIVLFPLHADDTLEEATALSQFLSSRGWKRVLVVTSNYHTRRARYIYERVLPPGFELRVISAPDSEYDPDNWWRTREGEKIFLHELIGYPVAIWELRNRPVHVR
ncbi:MAG TPA: YdcF family protein [Verrucomicrobiae bacterium]|nr:YdcF family protein [Verrucomicrobiae bacterium]